MVNNMKKLFVLFILMAVLCGLPVAAFAEQVASAAAPVPNKGDTAWMLVATILVILMSLPGLALFYGGLVRVKNMLSVLAQVFAIFCLIAILWVVYGYSLAFTAGGGMNDFIGGFSKVFLAGVSTDAVVETFSKGVVIPEMLFMVFQLTFAAITRRADRGRFRRAHQVLSVAGVCRAVVHFFLSADGAYGVVLGWASAYADPSGFIFGKGALDFAGGTVVHINAAMGALMGAIVLGKRIGYGKEHMAPHSLTMTHGRRIAAVGGLVWLQCRLQPRSQRHRSIGDGEYRGRNGCRRVLMDACGMAVEGQAEHAGPGFRCGRRHGCHHSGVRFHRPDGCHRAGFAGRLWFVSGASPA